MVTFILTYIGTSFVDSALSSDGFACIPEIARRKVLVLLYFGSILAGVTLLGVLTVSLGGGREETTAGRWEKCSWVQNTHDTVGTTWQVSDVQSQHWLRPCRLCAHPQYGCCGHSSREPFCCSEQGILPNMGSIRPRGAPQDCKTHYD